MKRTINYASLLLSATMLLFQSCAFFDDDEDMANKLDSKYEEQFSAQERALANTAQNEEYLSTTEKEVYYYLNLARLNPALFADTYVRKYDGAPGYSKGYAFDERKASLREELQKMSPLNVIKPDETLYEDAECFATSMGEQGFTGHDRSKTPCGSIHHAECCDYGDFKSGLTVVLDLLIDSGENNASLGHRRIMLDDFEYMGVAQRKHKKYGRCTVLDFWRRAGGEHR